MFTQHRRNILNISSSIAFVGGSLLTAAFSLLRRFNPDNARAKERHTGVLLKDIKIDKYGRTVTKHQNNGNLNAGYDDYVQDKWCPPEDPSKCTMKQCGCPAPGQQCKCPSPPPDKQCNCPPPGQQCKCPPQPNQICDCPDLICPCPKPPKPPWPVPDLICPCPKPPKPPS